MSLYRVFYLRELRNLDSLKAYLETHWVSVASKRPLRIEVIQEGDKRSSAANRHYFGAVLRQIADQAKLEGIHHSPEIWHEVFKRKFIGLVDLPNGGSMGKSSANLDAESFANFVQEVESFAATTLKVVFTDKEFTR